ncbi:MAG: carboxypeptidase regulatory-like domain-containing protein [Candidatus Tectomicrobia bacterium]|nr:carboxypeptidase regulatory-like domain-containing protein [Candidatus Tectomicrobia bacterium]
MNLAARSTPHGGAKTTRRATLLCLSVLLAGLVLGLALPAAALPPSVEINPNVVVIQPFDFSFTLMDGDGIGDLDPTTLIYNINGLDIGSLIVADILRQTGGREPGLRIEALDASTVRVTFSSVVLSAESTTNISILIRDQGGEEGSAEVTLLAPPAPPFVATTVEGVNVQASTVRNVTLHRGIELVGLVTTSSGLPVPDVLLLLERQEEGENGAPTESQTVSTNALGIYRFAQDPGVYSLYVFPPFGERRLVETLDINGPLRRDVVLENLFSLSGAVSDARGEPMPFGSVFATRTEENQGGSGFSSLDRDGHYQMFLPGGVYRVTATTSIGLEEPPPGILRAGAPESADFFLPPPQPPSLSFPTVIEAVEVRGDRVLDITVPDVFLLSGRILDQRQGLVRSARVTARAQDRDFSTQATSNERGNYTLALPAGTYRVAVAPPTGVLTPPQVGIRLPETVLSPTGAEVPEVVVRQDTVLDIALPDGLFVSGRVTDEENRPVSGAQVTITASGGRFTSSGFTNTDGLYLLAVPPGVYALRVTPNGGFIPFPEPFPGPRFLLGSSGGAETDVVEAPGVATGAPLE